MVGIPIDNPSEIARVIFGHDHWYKAEDILRDIFQPNARVAVKGCNASSKSYLAADAIVLTLLAGGDVLNTAPTGDQVEGVLWRQVRQTVQDCKLDTAGWKVNQTSIVLPTGETAQGRSTDQGVRFQGYHARPGAPLLIVVDEAPGVIGEIMEAIGGISAGGDVRLLLLGNPIIPQGAYYEIFERDLPNWTKHTISALQNPNFEGVTLEDLLAMSDEEVANDVRPYLATRKWVRDAYYEYGPNSAYWYSHVLGEFPLDAVESLISPSQIKRAQDIPGGLSEYIHPEKGGLPLVAGIDVAGPGEDETVVCIRQGRTILDLQSTQSSDPRGWVREILLSWTQRGLQEVHVDEIGQGYYFLKDLEDHLGDRGIRIIGINVGEKKSMSPDSQRKFANLKAELYWRLRERFIDGQIGGLDDLAAAIQLGSIRYVENRQGKTEIEQKSKLKSRGFKSPDRAEAIMLAFADGPGESDLYTPTGIGQRHALRENMGRGWSLGSSRKGISPSYAKTLRNLQRGKFTSR